MARGQVKRVKQLQSQNESAPMGYSFPTAEARKLKDP